MCHVLSGEIFIECVDNNHNNLITRLNNLLLVLLFLVFSSVRNRLSILRIKIHRTRFEMSANKAENLNVC